MAGQASKKSKRPDDRPARGRYWQRHRLRDNKVRNLVRCCGMAPDAALKMWLETRKGRLKQS